MIPASSAWRVVVWPDKGDQYIEWPRDEDKARALFASLVHADVPCCLVRPSGVANSLNAEAYDRLAA